MDFLLVGHTGNISFLLNIYSQVSSLSGNQFPGSFEERSSSRLFNPIIGGGGGGFT